MCQEVRTERNLQITEDMARNQECGDIRKFWERINVILNRSLPDKKFTLIKDNNDKLIYDSNVVMKMLIDIYDEVSNVDPLDSKFDRSFFINQVNEIKKY